MARRILGEDVTQIDYYTERVKRMVGKVLTGNGITRGPPPLSVDKSLRATP